VSDTETDSAQAAWQLNQWKNDERNATQQAMIKDMKLVTKSKLFSFQNSD